VNQEQMAESQGRSSGEEKSGLKPKHKKRKLNYMKKLQANFFMF